LDFLFLAMQFKHGQQTLAQCDLPEAGPGFGRRQDRPVPAGLLELANDP
jgi:hypothetical protein